MTLQSHPSFILMLSILTVFPIGICCLRSHKAFFSHLGRYWTKLLWANLCEKINGRLFFELESLKCGSVTEEWVMPWGFVCLVWWESAVLFCGVKMQWLRRSWGLSVMLSTCSSGLKRKLMQWWVVKKRSTCSKCQAIAIKFGCCP